MCIGNIQLSNIRYLCAGRVILPDAYNDFKRKADLWRFVVSGGRPEKLQYFTDECWNLMTICWSERQEQRPLPGVVAKKLDEIVCKK